MISCSILVSHLTCIDYASSCWELLPDISLTKKFFFHASHITGSCCTAFILGAGPLLSCFCRPCEKVNNGNCSATIAVTFVILHKVRICCFSWNSSHWLIRHQCVRQLQWRRNRNTMGGTGVRGCEAANYPREAFTCEGQKLGGLAPLAPLVPPPLVNCTTYLEPFNTVNITIFTSS